MWVLTCVFISIPTMRKELINVLKEKNLLEEDTLMYLQYEYIPSRTTLK
jgi:hypothetical protein